MKIGQVRLDNPVIAAPMAGVTDKAFRILAKEAGCGLVCTEMVSDMGLNYNNHRTKLLLDIEGEEHPISVQIFGSDPVVMAKAAQIVESLGADLIDINMGCPAPKIVKNGEGSALMRNLPLAEQIIKTVVQAVNIPVTVKTRKGWDDTATTAVELAKRAEAAGAQAVTIHGRTREQYYSGRADWEIITKVKQNVSVPVIGNGDIFTPQDAKRMLVETSCDGVMIGRGAMGNPWLYSATVKYLQDGELVPKPTAREKLEMAIRHLALIKADKGDYVAVREMRKHAAWYIKGLKGAAKARQYINQATTEAELVKSLLDYLQWVETGENPHQIEY